MHLFALNATAAAAAAAAAADDDDNEVVLLFDVCHVSGVSVVN